MPKGKGEFISVTAPQKGDPPNPSSAQQLFGGSCKKHRYNQLPVPYRADGTVRETLFLKMATHKLRGVFSVVCPLQKSTQLRPAGHWAISKKSLQTEKTNPSIWKAGSRSLGQAYQNWYDTVRNIRKGNPWHVWFVLRHSSKEQQLQRPWAEHSQQGDLPVIQQRHKISFTEAGWLSHNTKQLGCTSRNSTRTSTSGNKGCRRKMKQARQTAVCSARKAQRGTTVAQ